MVRSKRKLIPLLFIIGVCFFLFFFVITSVYIGKNVKNQCRQSMREYGGDCVPALITLLNDENKSFRARNSAIWALGQLGDSQALPALQKYYTGNVSRKESFDKVISQYELQKAIKLTSGGFNLTAFLWRNKIW